MEEYVGGLRNSEGNHWENRGNDTTQRNQLDFRVYANLWIVRASTRHSIVGRRLVLLRNIIDADDDYVLLHNIVACFEYYTVA
jgi:hypothetical protein